jgi:antitoxin component YwqK of YwqJK toxin-antitoxin module
MKKYFKQTQSHTNLRDAMETGDHSKNGASPKSQMSRGNFKNYFLIVIALILSISMFAQERVDTIYYDKDWKGVSNRVFADFYRIAIYPANNNYKKLFRDYYISGELQASGVFVSIDKLDDSKSIFDGETITYFKSGKVHYKNHYWNGKRHGEQCEYSEDGLVVKKGNFSNGKLSGLYTEFLENGAFIQEEYISGEPKYDYYVMSNQSGQIVKIKYSDNKPLWESPSVSEQKTEYHDGVLWQYYIKNGLTIAQTNTTVKDYGKWHKIDLIITNNSMLPIEFDPETDITAYSVDKKVRAKVLAVWSCDKYMKKVRKAHTWAAIGVGLAEGLSTANAGYSTSTTNSSAYYNGRSNSYGSASAYGSGGYAYGSYSGNSSYSGSAHSSSTTTTYDAAAAYQARVLSQQRMADFDNAQWNERNAKQMGYLKKNTIYPGETIQGYVHIQRISGVFVYITVNINSAKYVYEWKYGK